jgi:hypothetical protein
MNTQRKFNLLLFVPLLACLGFVWYANESAPRDRIHLAGEPPVQVDPYVEVSCDLDVPCVIEMAPGSRLSVRVIEGPELHDLRTRPGRRAMKFKVVAECVACYCTEEFEVRLRQNGGALWAEPAIPAGWSTLESVGLERRRAEGYDGVCPSCAKLQGQWR